MLTTIRTISVVAIAAMLTACAGGGGGGGAIAGAPAPILTAGVNVPLPGTPITTPCAANTFCGVDATTMSATLNVTNVTTGAYTFVGGPTVLGATQFNAALHPVTGNLTSATISGDINTTVATLTLQPFGNYIGTAANGLEVGILARGNPHAATGFPGVPATAASPTAGLTYSNFGDWSMARLAVGQQTVYQSYWAGGTQLTASMPTSGSATYTGIMGGNVDVNAAGTWTSYDLSGSVALTANFTAGGGTITGSMTNMAAFQNGISPFNDLTLSGTINGNGFTGSVTAGTVTAVIPGPAPAAFAPGASGTAAGHFYGPAANEVTGVWSISTPTAVAMGSFGAKQ